MTIHGKANFSTEHPDRHDNQFGWGELPRHAREKSPCSGPTRRSLSHRRSAHRLPGIGLGFVPLVVWVAYQILLILRFVFTGQR